MYVLMEWVGEPYNPDLEPSATFDNIEDAKGYANTRVAEPVVWTPGVMGSHVGKLVRTGRGRLFEIRNLPHNPTPEGEQ